jgi:prepilin-type processing-associated H-X9-DG protein
MGVGIFWANGGADWDAKSYKTYVVKDPAGTILLVEEPNGSGPIGNIWPCISIAPSSSGSSLCQLDPTRPVQDPSSNVGVNEGWHTYQLHGGRFNYLFHDNHVEALKIEQTVGTGTANYPKGMWTVTTGD